MNFLWYLGSFLLALGVLVVVHEFGHFIVARWCGVKVLRFSVGFGYPLLIKKWGKDQTEWAIAAFPLGGFVKMLDEREAPVPPELLHRAFNRQSVWKRMAIVVAGPLANLLLAVAIYQGIFLHGSPDLKPIVTAPLAGSPAASAGFQAADVIKTIDGDPVVSWTELRKVLLNGVLDKRSMKVGVEQSDGLLVKRQLDASAQSFDGDESDPAVKLGLAPFRPPLDPVVGEVSPESAASTAGIVSGDRVISINGDPVTEWDQIVKQVRSAYGKTLVVEIRRSGMSKTVTVVPATVEEGGQPVGRLGIGPKLDPSRYAAMMVDVRYGFLASFDHAIGEVWHTSALSLRMIGRMIIGQASVKNLSGPVTIADYAGQSAKMGLSSYLRFLALISISLGVLNLLPVPILDGGHLMYYLAELFKGSPVSDSVLAVGQRIGFGMLALLMLFALYNDIHRLIAG